MRSFRSNRREKTSENLRAATAYRDCQPPGRRDETLVDDDMRFCRREIRLIALRDPVRRFQELGISARAYYR